MSKKKGAVIAIIVFIAGFSVLVAYSATLYRQEQVVPEPTINTVDHSQLTANDSGPADGSTTIAENNAEQLPPVANGTIITNSTIVINKPVYNNNTMIYQPVKIHLEDYKATINQNVEVENNQARSSAKPSTGKTFSITIHTQSNPSDGSSEKLADDKVGMFIAVYDIKGKLVKSGFASENGFTVKGLQNSLYFVYPADCNNCNHSRNDIIFGEWEDGSKARPRLIPAGSDVTAIYNIEMEKAKETTKQAPAEETETSSAPEIKLKATDATYVYGWVQVDVQFVNKVQGYDDVLVKVFAPNGTLQDSFNYSDQQGFFTPRQAGEGDYRIVATYKYDKFTAKDEITHQVKFATPEFVNLAATADNGTVRLSGLMKGGLAGENVSIAIHDSDNTVVKKYNATFGTRPVISLFIGSEDAGAIFNKTGNYTFIVTHLETGTHGSATLFYDAGRNTTIANTSVNLSGNSGKSERPDIAVSGDNIYAVWQDDTSAQQQVMFTKSTDGGFTFDKPVIISKSQQGGFSNAPDIAVSGDNVYVVWADYDSEELAAVAFRSSTDGGRTFDNMTVLGNYSGETPKPQVVVNNDVIYVSWVTGAIEDFTGNLMLAQSTDGGSKFETKLMAENVSDAVAVGAGNNLYLAWRYFPSGETSNDTGIANIFAAGNESQAIPELQKMTIYSMAASDDAIYIAGTVGDSVVLAQSIGRANFSTTTIGTGILPDVGTSGGKVYVTWEQDGKIYIATSKDGGTTFSNRDSISDDGQSHFPALAASKSVHIAWSDGGEIFLAAAS